MFEDIVGHKKQLQALQKLVDSGRSHAVLLEGPDGVGKRTIARLLMTHLMESSELKTHPDVMEISESRSISIDQIRELTAFIARKPQMAKMRVGFIHKAHTMAPLAADALLKTLEEPRGDRMLILTAAHRALLPETVASRMSVISFDALDDRQVSSWIDQRYPDLEQSDKDYILSASGGSLGKAHFLGGDSSTLSSSKEMFLKAQEVIGASASEKMRFAAGQFVDVKENTKKREIAQALFTAFEHALHQSVSSGKYGITAGRALSGARHDLNHNVAPQAVIEHLLLSL